MAPDKTNGQQGTTIASLHGTVHKGPSGPPIVLLHSLAMDASLWDEHVGELTQMARVVTCDLPGHGLSHGTKDVSIEEMADEVVAFLDSRLSGPVILVGLSLGGCVAQSLATRHPAAVVGLLLADTTPWYGPRAPQEWEARAERARDAGLGDLAEFQLARWFSPTFLGKRPHLAQRLLEIFQANDLDSYMATCRAMGHMDLRPGIGNISVPTTVLVGEIDPATPVRSAKDLAARIRGARLRVVNGCSHLSPIEAPEVFLEEIRLLVQDVKEASA